MTQFVIGVAFSRQPRLQNAYVQRKWTWSKLEHNRKIACNIERKQKKKKRIKPHVLCSAKFYKVQFYR